MVESNVEVKAEAATQEQIKTESAAIASEAADTKPQDRRFASPPKFQMPPTMPFMPPHQVFNPMLRPQMMAMPGQAMPGAGGMQGPGLPGMLPPLPHPLILKIQNEPLGTPTATVYVQNLNEKIKIADIKNSLF